MTGAWCGLSCGHSASSGSEVSSRLTGCSSAASPDAAAGRCAMSKFSTQQAAAGICLAVCAALMTACATGGHPKVPDPASLTPPYYPGAAAFVGPPVEDHWWMQLNDSLLSELIAEA